MVLKKTSYRLIFWLLLGIFSGSCAATSAEQNELDDITRQLKLLEYRVKVQASKPITDRQRFYFDYSKLQQDIRVIKQGINQYLNPVRAQPRDPIILTGDYQVEDKP